jgi:hypothetical protein
MTLWNMDSWEYLEHETVCDPQGRKWTVALMDLLGQKGDPSMPNSLQELQYMGVIDGSVDPAQPVFRQDLED